MSITTWSACCDGMSCALIQLESSYLKGFTGIQLIGNISEVAKNGLERAKAALEGLGHPVPQRRLVINLAPADMRKDGSQLDLAFAINLFLLIRDEEGTFPELGHWVFAAELGLDGTLKAVKNIVSFALEAQSQGFKGMVVAGQNYQDLASLIRHPSSPLKSLSILTFPDLSEVLSWIRSPGLSCSPNSGAMVPASLPQAETVGGKTFDDMVLTKEQKLLAMTIATGMHSLILYGSPGTGKSMFSERLTSLFPDLPSGLHLEALKIHSSSSARLSAGLLSGRPPFRSPHHQASPASVTGVPGSPGEISLAHGGILFLDEIPEFRRDILESLREPLETGEIRLSRAREKMTWKSDVTLVAACNLCPCGWYGSKKRRCSCPVIKILSYRRKLSGPVLDRIDLHINMPEPGKESPVSFLPGFLSPSGPQDSVTRDMRRKVAKAVNFSLSRNQDFGILYNKSLPSSQLLKASGLAPSELESILRETVTACTSQRTILRVLRVARTLADLRESPSISPEDVSQAWRWQGEFAARDRGDHALGLS